MHNSLYVDAPNVRLLRAAEMPMPRQNRVTPIGDIVAIDARGAWMGNRGILHNNAGEVQRSWRTKAWIICVLEFKARHRIIMSPGTYTELFFLDEATAFAAGHRPCGECRYHDYRQFKEMWIKANRQLITSDSPRIQEIDAVIHRERIGKDQSKVTYSESIGKLPDGVMILKQGNDSPYLILNGHLLKWTPNGYTQKEAADNQLVQVLTPKSLMKVLENGYEPQLHPSAKKLITR